MFGCKIIFVLCQFLASARFQRIVFKKEVLVTWPLSANSPLTLFILYSTDRFHMTSRQPHLCTKQWIGGHVLYKKIRWELNSFHRLKLSFTPSSLQNCWPRDWKRSIRLSLMRDVTSFTKIRYSKHLQKRSILQFKTSVWRRGKTRYQTDKITFR